MQLNIHSKRKDSLTPGRPSKLNTRWNARECTRIRVHIEQGTYDWNHGRNRMVQSGPNRLQPRNGHRRRRIRTRPIDQTGGGLRSGKTSHGSFKSWHGSRSRIEGKTSHGSFKCWHGYDRIRRFTRPNAGRQGTKAKDELPGQGRIQWIFRQTVDVDSEPTENL